MDGSTPRSKQVEQIQNDGLKQRTWVWGAEGKEQIWQELEGGLQVNYNDQNTLYKILKGLMKILKQI